MTILVAPKKQNNHILVNVIGMISAVLDCR
jgi:hypothetical protein